LTSTWHAGKAAPHVEPDFVTDDDEVRWRVVDNPRIGSPSREPTRKDQLAVVAIERDDPAQLGCRQREGFGAKRDVLSECSRP